MLILQNFFSVFEGAPFKPFKHTMAIFHKIFFLNSFSTFIKNAFDTNKIFFLKNMHVIKKLNKKIEGKVFKLQRFNKVFPNVCENALFWRKH